MCSASKEWQSTNPLWCLICCLAPNELTRTQTYSALPNTSTELVRYNSSGDVSISLAKRHRGSIVFRVSTATLFCLCQASEVAPSQLASAAPSCTTGQTGDPVPHCSYRQFLAWKTGLFVDTALLLAQKPSITTPASCSKGSHTR